MTKSKKAQTLVKILPLVGIALIVWEMRIYEITFVPFIIPFLIFVLTGLNLTPLLRKPMSMYISPVPFSQFLYNTITFGGIMIFAFMWTNKHFRSREETTSNETIISTGSLYGKSCHRPTVTIAY